MIAKKRQNKRVTQTFNEIGGTDGGNYGLTVFVLPGNSKRKPVKERLEFLVQ